VLCDATVAFLPRLERSFGRVKAFVVEHSEQLKLQNKKALVDIFESKDMQSNPMSCFCALFLKRYLHRLSGQQIAGVEGWERDLWVSETELVEKFLQMLQRREADLKMLGASSVEQLFSGHNKKTDLDLRFRYDFIRRLWSQLSVSDQERVRQVLEPFVHKVEQMPAKSVHDSKLLAGETGISCHAQGYRKVCGSCTGIVWTQNRGSCDFPSRARSGCIHAGHGVSRLFVLQRRVVRHCNWARQESPTGWF
jgi:hypothetical protein